MNLNYNEDIPLATNNPSVDQPGMLINTNSINSWVAIDHHGFEDDLGGYHTVIHQDSDDGVRTQVTNPGGTYTRVDFPAPIAGVNQVFSVDVTPLTNPVSGPNTQLFAMSGVANVTTGNGVYQLTGNNSIQNGGYQWIAGNLIQWGKVTTVLNQGASGTVTFQTNSITSIAFPNNIWVVQCTPFYLDDGGGGSHGLPLYSGAVTIKDNDFTRGHFAWQFRADPGLAGSGTAIRYQGFYWVAIGN